MRLYYCLCEREQEIEGAPFPLDAFRPEIALVSIHYLAAEGEPEPGSLGFAEAPAFCLHVPVEDRAERHGRNADAGVPDADLQELPPFRQLQPGIELFRDPAGDQLHRFRLE